MWLTKRIILYKILLHDQANMALSLKFSMTYLVSQNCRTIEDSIKKLSVNIILQPNVCSEDTRCYSSTENENVISEITYK